MRHLVLSFFFFLSYISIHAPLTGCDSSGNNIKGVYKYFNPRTPYGMRLASILKCAKCGHFNPRTPYGMRLNSGYKIKGVYKYFNPRTPYGMRLIVEGNINRADWISIHAPLTGCDILPSTVKCVVE